VPEPDPCRFWLGCQSQPQKHVNLVPEGEQTLPRTAPEAVISQTSSGGIFMDVDKNLLAIQITKELFLAILQQDGIHGLLGKEWYERTDQNMELLGNHFKSLSQKIEQSIHATIDP